MKIVVKSCVVIVGALLAAFLVTWGQPGDMGLPSPELIASSAHAIARETPTEEARWSQVLDVLGLR